jgi:hypothetical protein
VPNRNILNVNNTNLSNGPQSALPEAVERGATTGIVRETLQTVLTQATQQSLVTPWGLYNNTIANYPNDVVRLDVINANNQYLESNYRVTTFEQVLTRVTVDPERDLFNLGYISGKYRVIYKFHRNYLGSGDGHKLQIQEISADGLEIRVIPAVSTTLDNTSFLQNFGESFFAIPKSQVLSNLVLFKDANTAMRVFDYVQDKFTFPTTPYSIIFKLSAPAPDGVILGDFLWLAQQVSDDLVDTITIVPPKRRARTRAIAGPNWDAINKEQTAFATQYRDWEDLLSTNTQTSQDIVNTLLSSSFLEGVPLNIDYKEFKNFINFSSAYERLLNFKYKIQLLEGYNARIATLTTNLNGLPSSSVSSSVYFLNNVNDATTKKAALIGSLDGYEKYLYYESSSYVTNSFGEFYPSTWPKSTSTLPYVNYSYTSSQVETWFEGILTSASLYDQNNEKALYKLIPAHIQENDANEGYVLFTHMIGHYFDLVFAYVKAMSDINNRDQSLLEGFSKELVFHVAQNLGVDFENGTSLEELWNYALGTDVTGSLSSTYGITTQDKTRETWKRIINNLPYLLKTKGTERGVRALINCFGIPQTILRIREFGGAEPDFDTKTDYVHERFFYATRLGQITGSAFQYLSTPWESLPQNSLKPMTIEVRAKMAKNQTGDKVLMGVKDQWLIKAFQSGSGDHLGFFLKQSGSSVWVTSSFSCSVYDGNWYHIALHRENKTDVATQNQVYKLVAKRVNYEKVVATYSASFTVTGSTPAGVAYNRSFLSGSSHNAGIRLVTTDPTGFPTTFYPSSSWTGSIQEIKFWSETLNNSILDNHALAPTSFQGNTDGVFTGSTSSFYTLGARFTLGSDNIRQNYNISSSIQSRHPDQSKLTYTGSFPISASILQSGSLSNYSGSLSLFFEPVTEIHSMEWPDLGANRSISNKIRIDETFLAGQNQLRRDSSVVRSLTDNYPPESSRLGIYLSPTNEVNQDIAEQFGGISIDDYIGDPSALSLDHYPDLHELQYEYFKKFTTGRRTPQNYIRLLRHYDSALFKLIKKFVPYRANTQVGLVIEPHLLTRAKLPVKLPTFEDLQYSSSIDLRPAMEYIMPGGFVQDGDGEPFRNGPDYVDEGVVNATYLIGIQSEPQQIIQPTQDTSVNINITPTIPTQSYNMVVIDGTALNGSATSLLDSYANEFNRTGIDDNPSTSGSMAAQLDLGITAYGRDVRVDGSQYIFYSYYQSGSQWLGYTSSRYDYHEAINPVILDNSRSAISNNGLSTYDSDIFFNKAFANYFTASYDVALTGSGVIGDPWLEYYGLRLLTSSYTNAYWKMSNTNGLMLYWTGSGLAGSAIQQRALLNAFFYDVDEPWTQNLLYEVKVVAKRDSTTMEADSYFKLAFGGLSLSSTEDLSSIGTTYQTYTYTVQPNGPHLIISGGIDSSLSSNFYAIKNLSIKCLNYRAQIQDFHLHDSYGMRNARYDGCKLTSADWNVPSTDTVDNGPVVEVTIGGGLQVNVSPNSGGNLQVL